MFKSNVYVLLLCNLYFTKCQQGMQLPTIAVYSNLPKLLHYLKIHITKAKFKSISSVKEIHKELEESNILVADLELLLPVLYDIPNVRWVQITRGGVDPLVEHVQRNRPLNFPILRYTGPVYATLLAEHTLHKIIHYERDINAILKNNSEKIWSTEGKIRDYRIISDLAFGMLGVGGIGLPIAECLRNFGGEIYGLRRNPLCEPPSVYKKIFYGKKQLPEFLKLCDYVISILPETKHTIGLLNDGILENCKEKQSVFINIGRGTVIDDQEVIRALQNKWLRAAILDVVNTEPMSKDNPLWSTPEVFITPHVAAYNRPQDIVKTFKTNLELYQKKKPLSGVIDFTIGY